MAAQIVVGLVQDLELLLAMDLLPKKLDLLALMLKLDLLALIMDLVKAPLIWLTHRDSHRFIVTAPPYSYS